MAKVRRTVTITFVATGEDGSVGHDINAFVSISNAERIKINTTSMDEFRLTAIAVEAVEQKQTGVCSHCQRAHNLLNGRLVQHNVYPAGGPTDMGPVCEGSHAEPEVLVGHDHRRDMSIFED